MLDGCILFYFPALLDAHFYEPIMLLAQEFYELTIFICPGYLIFSPMTCAICIRNCVTTSFATLHSISFVHILAGFSAAKWVKWVKWVNWVVEYALDRPEFCSFRAWPFLAGSSSPFLGIPLSAGQNILRFCVWLPQWLGNKCPCQRGWRMECGWNLMCVWWRTDETTLVRWIRNLNIWKFCPWNYH